MAHCVSEMFELNTRRVSSQVVGDNTAQTVMTKSIGFMPEIPGWPHQSNITLNYAVRPAWFQDSVKVPADPPPERNEHWQSSHQLFD